MSKIPIDPLLASSSGGSMATDHEEVARFDDAIDYLVEVTDAESQLEEPGHDDSFDVEVRENIEAAYGRLYPQLVHLAYFLVDTVDHAEDAVQDAFAKAYPKWDRIENPNTYMRAAVVNTCRRVQRRRSLVRRTPSPRAVDAVLGADHVADVVRRLPLKLRQVVVLRYYLQLSDPEIADTLGMALGTVKSSLHRARAQMREELS